MTKSMVLLVLKRAISRSAACRTSAMQADGPFGAAGPLHSPYNIVFTLLPILGRAMEFTWDDAKAAANLRKHGVAFELAAKVWDDPAHLLVFDRIENGEERWHAIGLVYGVVILTVVHAFPDAADDGLVRIVNARKATALERKRYEANDD